MLKNHKVKYLKHAESEKHNENLPKGRIRILKIVRNGNGCGRGHPSIFSVLALIRETVVQR